MDVRKVRNMPRRGPGWVPFCGLPPGKNYSRVLEMLGTPQKPKWAAAYSFSHSFPLGPQPPPAQKREKHPKPMKPCSTNGLQRRQKFEDIWYMLVLLDPKRILFKVVPQLCQDGNLFSGRVPTAAYDCLRFARKNYRGIILSNIFQKSYISHWVLGFF